MRELRFVENRRGALAAACLDLARAGRRRIALRPGGERALVERIVAEDAETARSIEWVEDPRAPRDAVVIHHEDPDAVSEALLECVDLDGAVVVAPITARYYRQMPLFLISIPKAGTHLLYRLAEALGYSEGVIAPPSPKPATWYCLEYSNSHTSARDFFIDTVRRSPFGNRDHPFPRTPTLFIYRHPFDILVAEAEYNHLEGNTIWWGYLAGKNFEERLLAHIEDPWLLGSCRDRIGAFVPWLEFPNVIPVSFEELVGSRGGGSDEVQERVIWSIMLKLHVPGDPAAIGARIFDPSSPTFRKGQIRSHESRFTPRAWERIRRIPQDFVAAFGYDFAPGEGPYPKRAEAFRRRPLLLSHKSFAEVDILLHSSSAVRCNILRKGDRYRIVPWQERIKLEGEIPSISFDSYEKALWFLPTMLLPLRHVARVCRVYQRLRRFIG